MPEIPVEGRYYGNESTLSDKADETDFVLPADRRGDACDCCGCLKYNVDGTSSACFEYLGAEEHCHKTSCFHCKCEKCGKLIHLHCEDVVKLEQHLMDSHGFRMDPCRTVFYGLCEECRSAEDGEKESETVHIRSK